MSSNFSSEFFAANRKRLRDFLPSSTPIVITANGLLQRNADTSMLFRQDSNFWYLTGCNVPDLVLVMDNQKDYLIVPPINSTREVFDGSINVDLLSARSGIPTVMDEYEGWKNLSALLIKSQQVATLMAPPSYIVQYGFYTNPARSKLVKRVKQCNPQIEITDLRENFAKMRMIKHPSEMLAIQQAIDITAEAFDNILNCLSDFSHEYEVEAALSNHFRKNGASGHAYQPIVASGANACTLHYIDNNHTLINQNLLLIDAGAELEMYAADITRTIALTKPNGRTKAVYEAVNQAQKHAFNLLKPGVKLANYEKAMQKYLGSKLKDLGLIKKISKDSVRKYVPHSMSHFLGLDVHDAADYNMPLKEGMVLTVEPGIYIPEESIGIRLEDDVLITKNGVKVLSNRLPKQLY